MPFIQFMGQLSLYLRTLQSDKISFEELIDTDDLSVAKAFRESIKLYFQSLSDNFDVDLGREFLYRHTRKLDEYLSQMFKFVIRRSFGEYVPMQSSLPVVLVALGSYGRQQLAVYSDIDIMILYKEVDGYNLKPLIERFVMMAWDAGLKVGHRTHEISEIVMVSQSDHTIKTALLESRFLIGSRFLWIEYQNVLNVVRKTNQKAFATQKLHEAKQRAIKYKISMEPNIKEGIGGLRSGNTMFWLSTSIYANTSNKDLIGKLYSENEYRDYRIGLDFIFRLRIALHLEAGKKQDVLIMQYQRSVALKLGFKDAVCKRAEYALVAKTLKSMAQVNLFCETYIQKLARKIFFGEISFAKLKSFQKAHSLFVNSNKCLVVSFNLKLQALKEAILNIAYIKEFDSIDASVIYWLKSAFNGGNFDVNFWLELLGHPKSHLILKALYDANRLCNVLPQFEGILYLAQFDGYHVYPVDIHTLECVRMLETIQDKFVLEVYNQFSERDKAYLKLLLLFHDIGKGRRQNHSSLGAKMFALFAKNAGFNIIDIELGKRIILWHTLMSDTALREDLNSEKTILAFTSRLQDERAVKLLFVLTYADMSGVGSHIYTFVNASLLRELYYKALDKLGKKELLFETAARLDKESHLYKSEDFITLDKRLQKSVRAIKSNLFFMQHDAKMIVAIANRVLKTDTYSFELRNKQRFELEIIRKKPINLGWLLGKLAFLDITSMDVFKLFDDAKFFRISFAEPLSEDDLPRVREWIDMSFDMNRIADYKRPLIERKNITIDCEHSQDYVKMQLIAKNQHGLLAFIIETFDKFDIDIATAKINTIRHTARDMFLIEKSSKICEQKAKVLKKLCEYAQTQTKLL